MGRNQNNRINVQPIQQVNWYRAKYIEMGNLIEKMNTEKVNQ